MLLLIIVLSWFFYLGVAGAVFEHLPHPPAVGCCPKGTKIWWQPIDAARTKAIFWPILLTIFLVSTPVRLGRHVTRRPIPPKPVDMVALAKLELQVLALTEMITGTILRITSLLDLSW